MNSNKAAYWIAIGVLALGLNSEYQQGNFAALHRVAGRAGLLVCQLTTKAEQTLAVAHLSTSQERNSDPVLTFNDSAAVLQQRAEVAREQAREQAELLRDQVNEQVRDSIRAQRDQLRAQAEMRRAEIEQMRDQIREQVRSQRTFVRAANRSVIVAAPMIGARIVAGPDCDKDSNAGSIDVEVDDNL